MQAAFRLQRTWKLNGNCQTEWKFILHAARAVINPAQALVKFISSNSGTMQYILNTKCFTYFFLRDQGERKEKEGKASSCVINHDQACRDRLN